MVIKRFARVLKKYEFLLYAFYCLILLPFHKSFFPSNPQESFGILRALLAFALYFFVLFLLEFAKVHRFSKGWLVFLFVLILLSFIKLMVKLSMIGVATILVVWPLTGKIVLASLLFLLLFFALTLTFKRYKVYRPTLRIIFLTAYFLAVISLVPICAWLWRIPDRKDCELASRSEFVQVLTPYDLAAHHSYPYELLYIPQKRLLCATFKMAGNMVLSFWDDPASNKIVFIDVSNPKESRTETFSTEDGLMPEYMAYNVKTEELLVTRLAFNDKRIDFINLKQFPKIELARSMNVEFEPHSLAVFPKKGVFVVFGVPQTMLVYDYATLQEVYKADIKFTHGDMRNKAFKEHLTLFLSTILVTNLWQHPSLPIIYVDMAGKGIVEIDLETKKRRYATVPWAGGNIVGVLETNTLYTTDAFFGALNVIDTSDMKLKKRVKLGYKSRAIQADFGRDLLIIGDWFGGKVNLYRLSTLEKLDYSVPVGPYLRDFAYDSERGLLFASSKCGVYQVDIAGVYRELAFKD